MDVAFSISVGGASFPVFAFAITGSCSGSVGSAQFTTSGSALMAAGVDLYSLTTSGGVAPVIASATIGSAGAVPIFGGEYLSARWDEDHDHVTISARSWAGELVDQRRVLTKIGTAVTAALKPLAPGQVTAAGISNENQQLSNIVTSIADEFGFIPVLNMPAGNPTIGTLYGSSDHTYMPVPRSLWSILTDLAKDTGYVVYDTPNRELVFGTPGAGGPPLLLTYVTPPGSGSIAMREVRLEHHPRRNSTFRVLVIAYDPTKAQVVLGRAVYVGTNYAGGAGLTAGLTSGAAAVPADNALAALDQSTSQIPLYTFHFDGMTQDQANAQATAIATDIAKREFICNVTIDGLPSIFPSQLVSMIGRLPSHFVQARYYVAAYTHRFRLPSKSPNSDDTGFTTHIKLLNNSQEGGAGE